MIAIDTSITVGSSTACCRPADSLLRPCEELSPDNVNRTLGALLEYQDDVEMVRGDRVAGLVEVSR